MACCPRGIYSALVQTCEGSLVPMPDLGLLRVGDLVVGGHLFNVTNDITLGGNAVVIADSTSNTVTINLPPAKEGWQVWVKRINTGANAVTVDGDGSETIDGSTTYTMNTQHDSAHFVCDGTEWWVI